MKANGKKLLCLLFVVIFLSSVICAVSANIGISGTIQCASGSWPQGVVYDPAKNEIFVTNEYFNVVSVISDTTNTVIANITVGTKPAFPCYDSAKGEIFVPDAGSGTGNGTISVISDATNAVVANITLGPVPIAGASSLISQLMILSEAKYS